MLKYRLRFTTRYRPHLTPDRAIFGGAFDIPFQIIASDPELQNSLTDGLDMTTAGGSD